MNKEDVKRLAREVADKDKVDPVNYQGDIIILFPEELMRLIDRIQAQEREACAKLCEEKEAYDIQIPCPDGIAGCAVCHTIRGSRVRNGVDCAKAIRTRCEVK